MLLIDTDIKKKKNQQQHWPRHENSTFFQVTSIL